MNIKYQIKNLLLVTSITIGLSATSAMANVVGFMSLELMDVFLQMRLQLSAELMRITLQFLQPGQQYLMSHY